MNLSSESLKIRDIFLKDIKLLAEEYKNFLSEKRVDFTFNTINQSFAESIIIEYSDSGVNVIIDLHGGREHCEIFITINN